MTGCLGYFHCVQQLQYYSRLNLLKRERRFNSGQIIFGYYVVCAREKFRSKFWTNCCKIAIQRICDVPWFSQVKTRVVLQFNYFGTAGLLTNQLFNNFPSSPLVTRCFRLPDASVSDKNSFWSTLFLYLPGFSGSYRLPNPPKFHF